MKTRECFQNFLINNLISFLHFHMGKNLHILLFSLLYDSYIPTGVFLKIRYLTASDTIIHARRIQAGKCHNMTQSLYCRDRVIESIKGKIREKEYGIKRIIRIFLPREKNLYLFTKPIPFISCFKLFFTL